MKAFENVDFILTPTVPLTAFKIVEKMDDPVNASSSLPAPAKKFDDNFDSDLPF